MTDPAIRHFLDLSTAHLSAEDRSCPQVSSNPRGDVRVYCAGTPHGWFLYAHQDRPDVSDNLWHLMTEARRRGCEYLLFDADAVIHDELPTYDEEEPELGEAAG
jgi:hypothetical protein